MQVEALTPNVLVFGNKSLKEVINITWDHKSGALIQSDLCP
jgi:hypothetical protein